VGDDLAARFALADGRVDLEPLDPERLGVTLDLLRALCDAARTPAMSRIRAAIGVMSR
jgi:hypothetical protein